MAALLAGHAEHEGTLSAALIDRFGSIGAVLHANNAQLRSAGAPLTVVEQLDLIRRSFTECLVEDVRRLPAIRSASDVIELLRFVLAYSPHEALWAFFLDARLRLLHHERIVEGTVDTLHAEPQLVLRRAVELDAAALIVAHNHPSGNPEASEADHRYTLRLRTAADAIGLRIVDHVIVARGGSYSFVTEGHL